VFLLPASLVSAELASGWPGGVYNWSQLGQIATVPYLLALLAATLLVGIIPPLVLHKLRRPGWKAAD